VGIQSAQKGLSETKTIVGGSAEGNGQRQGEKGALTARGGQKKVLREPSSSSLNLRKKISLLRGWVTSLLGGLSKNEIKDVKRQKKRARGDAFTQMLSSSEDFQGTGSD